MTQGFVDDDLKADRVGIQGRLRTLPILWVSRALRAFRTPKPSTLLDRAKTLRIREVIALLIEVPIP
jgi:hypothetical protein